MAVADASGLPIAAHVQSASPHEVKLVEATIGSRFVSAVPDRLIADKAYDSDELDHRLQRQMGIELIAPHRGNRKKQPSQDGRKLRRYKRRWKIERLFAWLQNFRRLVVRYEYHADNFLGMLQLGCAVILLRHF
jgi:transposase